MNRLIIKKTVQLIFWSLKMRTKFCIL